MALLATGLLALIALVGLRSGGATLFDGEDSLAEQASILLLLGALALYTLRCLSLGRLPGWAAAWLLIGVAGRELDLDKRIFDDGMLKTAFYVGPAPLWHKAVGLAVVALSLWALLRWVRHGWRPWTRALRAGAGWSWALFVALVLGLGAKSIDGLARKLAPFGIDVPNGLAWSASLFEEGAETVFALLILWTAALVPLFRGPNATDDSEGRNVANRVGSGGPRG